MEQDGTYYIDHDMTLYHSHLLHHYYAIFKNPLFFSSLFRQVNPIEFYSIYSHIENTFILGLTSYK